MQKTLTLFILLLACSWGFTQTAKLTDGAYFEGELIVKIKEEQGQKCAKTFINIPSIQSLVQELHIQKTRKLFPNHKAPKNKSTDQRLVDLSTLYRFEFDKQLDARKILQLIRANESVEYAELNYINELAYTPSDTLYMQQWYINAVDLPRAWDIQQGDTSVVIAFTDTGSDMDHEDLVGAYAYNYDDPINGIDDDNDGYIDNFNGWDVADNDNNAQLTNLGHGVNVAGIASASTDNVKGISGCGFNTRLLTVKIDAAATGQLTGAYQGIVYAADYGAFIITNSWGTHTPSQFAQDIINYAAINKGALVIAATGNNGDERRFYPAAYENVLSVGSMTYNDTVKSNSNFGYWTDIFAPGDDMLTTNAIGEYNMNGGTSMAAPVVAGIAALVKSQFPHYTARQVMEQLMNSGDNVEAINDPKYRGKIGVGQINAFTAVSDSSKPGIGFINRNFYDNNDGVYFVGDTIRLSGDFKNYLRNGTNVNVTVSVIDNKMQVLNGNRNLGNINRLDSVSVANDPFQFLIDPSAGFNETVEIEITITADNYSKKEYYPLTINKDYLTISENDLTVTIASNAGIGFSGPSNNLGEGISYLNGNSLLFEGSFMVGNSANYLANKFRANQVTDNDFVTTTAIHPITAKSSDYETEAVFNDGNISTPAQLEIRQQTFVFRDNPARNSIIYNFAIKNTGATTLTNLYAGLVLDWDIHNYANNKIIFDANRKMGVSYATDTSLYCGVRLLNDSIGNVHYAIDNSGNGHGGLDLGDGFSDAEKFTALTTFRNSAGGINPMGNDIIDVNSAGPFDLDAGSTQNIAFAIIVSDGLTNLEVHSDSTQEVFDRLILNTIDIDEPILSNRIKLFPNPVNEQLGINLQLSSSMPINMKLYDLNGRLVETITEQIFSRGSHQISLDTRSLKTGVYFLEVEGENLLIQNKFVVAK